MRGKTADAPNHLTGVDTPPSEYFCTSRNRESVSGIHCNVALRSVRTLSSDKPSLSRGRCLQDVIYGWPDSDGECSNDGFVSISIFWMSNGGYAVHLAPIVPRWCQFRLGCSFPAGTKVAQITIVSGSANRYPCYRQAKRLPCNSAPTGPVGLEHIVHMAMADQRHDRNCMYAPNYVKATGLP